MGGLAKPYVAKEKAIMIHLQPPASEGDRAGIVSSKIPAEPANGRRQRPACCVPGVRGAGGKYGTTTNHELCRLGANRGPQVPKHLRPHYFALNGTIGVNIMQTYPTGYAQSHRMAEHIFRDILPQRGMAVREEQIALCHEILDTLYNKEISMCEAGVGIGKTLAYLVACVLWQMNRPDRLKLPVVISTSSVALQDAIINDYLPNLSAILLEERIIQVPLTAVIRKGKERFVCDARLIERESQIPATRKRQRNSLHMAERTLDMDHIPELSRFDRNRICVPQSCPRDCVWHESCRFQQYLRDSMKPDIQICNHNYLLADAAHRQQDRPLLLRSYQALVVDEAHKLPDAARQMYTESFVRTRNARALHTSAASALFSHCPELAHGVPDTGFSLSA